MLAADPVNVGISAEMVVGGLGWAFTALVGALLFFARHAAKNEKTILDLSIGIVKDVAEKALAESGENARKLRDLERTSDQMGGEWKALRSDVDRLDAKDDEQEHYILDLRSRLDKGARTASTQMPASTPGDYEPPPMRRRLPSSRGGGGE